LKYLPVVFTVVAFFLTFSLNVSLFVLIFSAIAYGFAPRGFTFFHFGVLCISLILFLIISTLLYYEISSDIIIIISCMVVFAGFLFFLRKYLIFCDWHDSREAQSEYEKIDKRIKGFAVTPIFLFYFLIIIFLPTLNQINDIRDQLINQLN